MVFKKSTIAKQNSQTVQNWINWQWDHDETTNVRKSKLCSVSNQCTTSPPSYHLLKEVERLQGDGDERTKYTVKNSEKANNFTFNTINSCLIEVFHWRSLAKRAGITIAEFAILTVHTNHIKLCQNHLIQYIKRQNIIGVVKTDNDHWITQTNHQYSIIVIVTKFLRTVFIMVWVKLKRYQNNLYIIKYKEANIAANSKAKKPELDYNIKTKQKLTSTI